MTINQEPRPFVTAELSPQTLNLYLYEINQNERNCYRPCRTFPWQSDLPLLVVCVTVAVVLGVGAVPVDATGTFLDARHWAPPVEVFLTALTHPPRVRGPIWGASKPQTRKQQYVSSFQEREEPKMMKIRAATSWQTFVEAVRLWHLTPNSIPLKLINHWMFNVFVKWMWFTRTVSSWMVTVIHFLNMVSTAERLLEWQDRLVTDYENGFSAALTLIICRIASKSACPLMFVRTHRYFWAQLQMCTIGVDRHLCVSECMCVFFNERI